MSISSGRPPTLWCDFIVSRRPPPLSIQSGAIVPCTRYFAPDLTASLSKTLMNFSPIIFRFLSGSITPFRAAKNSSLASTTMWLTPSRLSISSTALVSPFLMNPVSTYTPRRCSPIALLTMPAQTVLSTPPDAAIIAFPFTSALSFSTCSSMNFCGSNI
jgi:hypothetical protein